MYSSICGELASYGNVVCAVEHRDGSGPRTYVNHAPNAGASELADTKKGHHTQRGPLKLRHGYDIVDYVFPQHNRFDTGPNNKKGVDRELRDYQIDLRMAEIEEAYSAICAINAGKGQELVERNLRRKGFHGASSHGLSGIDWNTWRDRLHITSVTALGHSFGAATCVEMLRHRLDRFDWLGQGIILDIWSAGTRPTRCETDAHQMQCPLVAINSEAFTYWPSNFDFVSQLTSEANSSPTWLATIRGTVHLSPSDFPILYPHITSLLLKSMVHPHRAIDLHVDICLTFLDKILPRHFIEPFSHAYPEQTWLKQLPMQALEQIPSGLKKRPTDRFVASRLRIKHEWKYRLAPTAKIGKKWILSDPEYAEADKSEVWVHHRPVEGKVDKWIRQRDGEVDGPAESPNEPQSLSEQDSSVSDHNDTDHN